jgi:hypothetical protein
MRKFLLAAVACIAIPGVAFAADVPAKPEKCCCEKMKAEAKGCCADKDKAAKEGSADPHAGHTMEMPKS